MNEKEPRYIFCRFLDENGNPKGREYTYKTTDDVQIGDFVYAMTPRGEQKIIVSALDVDEAEFSHFIDKIKPVYKTPVEKDLAAKEQ